MSRVSEFLSGLTESADMRAFARSMSLYGASASIAQVIMMVYTLVVARHLGVAQYGIFAGAYSLSGLTAFVVNWGLDTWLLREAAMTNRAYGDERDVGGQVTRVKLVLGVVWAVLLVGLAPLIRPDLFLRELMLVCAVDTLVESLVNTQIAVLNTQKRMQDISHILIISRTGRLAGAVMLISLGGFGPLAFAVARSIATLIGLMYARFRVNLPLAGGTNIHLLKIWQSAAPYGLSELMALIYLQVDVTMISIILGKEATGIYAPAVGIIAALFVLPNVIYLAFIPRLSRILGESLAGFFRWAGGMMSVFLLLGIALTTAVAIGGEWVVVTLLRQAFAESGQILTLLSPILLFKSLSFGFGAILVSIGWQRFRLIPQAVASIVAIGVNLWAIPNFGVRGAAWVYLLGELVLMVGYGLIVIVWGRKRNTA